MVGCLVYKLLPELAAIPMTSHNEHGFSPTQFPVSVIIQRQQIQHGRWSVPRWELVGLVAGESIAGADAKKSLIRSDEDGEQYLWSGFVVQLYKDSAESYWYNLVGKQPSLFVICRPDDDGDLVPFAVSANYDEAGAYMEADDTVLSAPMPPEVHQWLEHYVLEHYTPQQRGKRKRKNWVQEGDDGPTAPERSEGERH